MKTVNNKIFIIRIFFESIFFLIMSWAFLRLFGIKIVKWHIRIKNSNHDKVEQIYNMTLKVSQFLPFQSKCIEISTAVKFIAALHKIQVSVVLGVSNNPFAAHAWIKSNEKSFGAIQGTNYTIMGIF